MPPTGANAKVKDPEYCNWLKVGLALYYLKDGISSFIENEVDAMHKFILPKLYNASTVPAPLCSSCNAKDVKQNRNGYTWKFKSPCPISLCDTWLTELLALCTNPTSSKLYCENCDVTAWPKTPWECTKFYMPRGQTVNNTGPAQSDSQALLTLMANCKYLNSKLSPGGIQLTNMVSKIRNTVMHSGDMRLSDNERTSFITDIIKLLEDPCHLKSLDECKKAVLEINKINTDSLEVFFNTDMEVEMKALSACVKDLRQELGVYMVETEKTVESLKEELKDHQNQLEHMQKNVNLLKRKNRMIRSQQKKKVKKLEKMGTEFKQFSRTVTSDLKDVKREVRTQSASCLVVKKAVNLLKRKTLTGLSLQKKKVRKLEKEMQLIKECDSQASGATAVQLSEMNMESDVRDIQLLFINAYKGVQIISVNAVLDNAVYWKELEDFYTDIVIEEEEESTQTIKNELQFKKAVTSFRQIFEKCDRKVTRIILEAPAGQGKSTFCRKLVHTWCSVQKKQLNIAIDDGTFDRSETSGIKHEDELLRFDVLLYICLRDISDEKTLMDVVYSQFPLVETQGHMSHIEALIGQADNNKVLLIMDGLDEMDNSLSFIGKILRRELYPNLTVLATTRSWKIGELRLIRSAHFDLLLDLQGFSFDNSMLFAKRIFDKYYKDESAIAQFKQDILKNDVIRSLIHVPLLLLFIVQVWYDRKSFPQTIHELYLEMLDVIVNRYMKGKKRIEKNQGKQDRKWPLESTTFNANPKLSKLSLVKHFGADFLAALCEIANHFFIKAFGKTSLVFDEEVLLELLGNEGTSKLQTALDLGILSKSESRGTFHEKIRLTFLHKTVQEFLAAINICCREDKCNMFLDSLKTCDDVLQNEQIIKFAAGISTTQCQRIFEKIYEVCDIYRLKEHRMPDLNRFYIECIREAHRENLCLKLYCIYAAYQKIWNELQSALKNTLKVRIHLKYLCLKSCILIDAELHYFEFQYLTKLKLQQMTVKGKLLLSKCTNLKCLNLNMCTLDDDVLDLSECTCLEDLRLKNVTMKGKLLLSKCIRLKCLHLNKCTLDDDVLDLSESVCLEDISLTNVTMKGKLLLSKCTGREYLNVYNCTLDHFALNLSECTCLERFLCNRVILTGRGRLLCSQLQQLILVNCNLGEFTLDMSTCPAQNTSMENADLNDALLSQDNVNNCIQLTLDNVTMSKECKEVFCKSLSQCKYLERLSIKNVDLCDARLSLEGVNYFSELKLDNVTMSKECKEVFCNSLSQCKTLEKLSIKNVDLCDARLSLDSVNYVYLYNVTMSKECKKVFCKSLSQCKTLVKLSIKNVDLCDGRLSLDSVNNVYLDNVTMSKECKKVFCKSLSQCTQLAILSINNADLCDGLLSLDSVNYFSEFNLDNVTMSKKCKEVFCKSLSQCTKLKRLSIKNVDLCDGLLSLDSVNYFSELNLDNVTMSKKRKEVFCKSLSQCTKLKRLSIKNLDLCDARLSLVSENYIWELSLDNVTMSKECKKVFYKSLSQCTHLVQLSITNVDLCDALLSLVSVNYVYLDNVTMSKECNEVFCKSMSQCKRLLKLSIKNVDLGDASLSLEGTNHFDELFLDNVTMSKECKDKFFKRMSQCKKLERLSVMNMDLCGGLHELYNMKRLNYVALEGVKIGTLDKVLMCKSLCQCTQLKNLSLKNLDLGDGLLNLNKLGILSSLTIDNVTMCKDGYLMLCSSISTCKHLNLSLKNLDLGDGQLCLDNLEEFELVNITMSLKCVDYIKSSQQCQLSSCFKTALSIEIIANSSDKCVVNYIFKREDDVDDDHLVDVDDLGDDDA